MSRALSSPNTWWKGSRGEWFVVVQIVLIALVFFGPRSWEGGELWPPPLDQIAVIIGLLLLAVGILLFAEGLVSLGRNLTPVPHPKEDATLVQTGAYKIVRHPIYGGGILLAFGWALFVHGWLTLLYAIVLFAFLDVKSRREEQWLEEKFSNYKEYRKRVRKLIPFVY